MYKEITKAFAICTILTGIMVSIVRPGSAVFIPCIVLQIAAFAVMFVISLFLDILGSRSKRLNYLISFIVGYTILMVITWNINGASLLDFLISYHIGKEFFTMVLPFIVSNLFIFAILARKTS